MTDLQLLGAAAYSAGLKIVGEVNDFVVQPGHLAGGLVVRNNRGGDSLWNPLTDDGDAFRLQVLLRIDPRQTGRGVMAGAERTGENSATVIQEFYEDHKGDICAATRRAIVRAAAARAKEIA